MSFFLPFIRSTQLLTPSTQLMPTPHPTPRPSQNYCLHLLYLFILGGQPVHFLPPGYPGGLTNGILSYWDLDQNISHLLSDSTFIFFQ